MWFYKYGRPAKISSRLAPIGLAFDGDADRIMTVEKKAMW